MWTAFWIFVVVLFFIGFSNAAKSASDLITELEEKCRTESDPVVRQHKYMALARYKQLVMECKPIANAAEKATLVEAIKA